MEEIEKSQVRYAHCTGGDTGDTMGVKLANTVQTTLHLRIRHKRCYGGRWEKIN